MGRNRFTLLADNQRPVQAKTYKHPEIEQAFSLCQYFQNVPVKLISTEDLKGQGVFEGYKKLGLVVNVEEFAKEYNRVFEQVATLVAKYFTAGEIYGKKEPVNVYSKEINETQKTKDKTSKAVKK